MANNQTIKKDLEKLFRKLGLLDTKLKSQAYNLTKIDTVENIEQYYGAVSDLGQAAQEVHQLMTKIFETALKVQS